MSVDPYNQITPVGDLPIGTRVMDTFAAQHVWKIAEKTYNRSARCDGVVIQAGPRFGPKLTRLIAPNYPMYVVKRV